MMAGAGCVTVPLDWTALKAIVTAKVLPLQYVSDSALYEPFAVDDGVVYQSRIWRGTVPSGVVASYSQAQNDADKSDFEANHKPYANNPLQVGAFPDPRLVYRLGNVTTTSANEVLVSARTYNEPASQAQRSVKSTSANDSNPSGSGAKEVRITYLDSNYVLKTEDVLLNGTGAVNTVATDIRFIERFEVIKGAAAAGAVELFPNTGGTGTAICGLGVGTEQAFLCHHYVPAGKRAWIVQWGACVDDEANLKLIGQARYGANLVDRIQDLEKLAGIATPPGRIEFERNLRAVALPEKTYVRLTVAPLQATSTVTRARLVLWETTT